MIVHARDLIHDSLDGELAPDEEVRLGSHLRECAACRAAESELRRNDLLLARREPLPTAPPMRLASSPWSGVFLPAIALGAAMILALVVGNALAAWRAGPDPGSSAAAAPGAVVSSVGVCGQAREQAARSPTRVERLQWKRISLKDLIDSGLFTPSRDIASQDEGKLRSTMVCAVAVTGELHVRLGLIDSGPDRWAIFFSIAGSGQTLGLVSGNSGSLPASYDALPSTRVDPASGMVVQVIDDQTVAVQLESPMMSQEFGSPARFFADRFTDIRPAAGTLAKTGVKAGDRVQIFFERDGRDARGAYPLSSFLLIPGGLATPQVAGPRPGDLPVCPPGQLPQLDITFPPPPGDQPGTGAASAEEAFRRAYPNLTEFTMYPVGSARPVGDPRALGRGPVWIVSASDTYVATYIGEPGLNSWFVHPAKFVGCHDASTRPSPTEVPVPLNCGSYVQAALPVTPVLYPTRTAAEVTSGLRNDPYFRHTLEDIAGVRQDSNPLRDAGVLRCAVDALRTGDPVFVRSFPSETGLWYVPVIHGDRQVLLITVGRNEAGVGVSGGSVGGGGSGGMFPPMSRAKALQVGGTTADPAASAELVFASAIRGARSVAWRIVRTSGSVFYLFPDFPGASPDGMLLPEAQVVTGI